MRLLFAISRPQAETHHRCIETRLRARRAGVACAELETLLVFLSLIAHERKGPPGTCRGREKSSTANGNPILICSSGAIASGLSGVGPSEAVRLNLPTRLIPFGAASLPLLSAPTVEIPICSDCLTECCGQLLCEDCYDYHASYSCLRKPSQDVGQTLPRRTGKDAAA